MREIGVSKRFIFIPLVSLDVQQQFLDRRAVIQERGETDVVAGYHRAI